MNWMDTSQKGKSLIPGFNRHIRISIAQCKPTFSQQSENEFVQISTEILQRCLRDEQINNSTFVLITASCYIA
jgi:hypothetical protein